MSIFAAAVILSFACGFAGGIVLSVGWICRGIVMRPLGCPPEENRAEYAALHADEAVLKIALDLVSLAQAQIEAAEVRK